MKYSVLDFSSQETTVSAKKNLNERIKLARLTESMDYHRFWISENEANSVLVGSTPELIMAHLALATDEIRIGSAGIMLPYYNGEKIADTFKTMDVVRNNRIDVGVGQAAGKNWFSKKLNEDPTDYHVFEREMKEVQHLLEKTNHMKAENAYTSLMKNGNPEIFIINSNARNTPITAEIGAGFFAPYYLNSSEELKDAIRYYQEHFVQSNILEKAHVMLAVFVAIGNTPQEIEQLKRDFNQWDELQQASDRERDPNRAIIGTGEEVVERVSELAKDYLADEVMLIPNIENNQKRAGTIQSFAEALAEHRRAHFG